jgi:ferritin-like metal-binding protein YciE
MNPAQQKVVQYLEEARATERALVRVLQSQIAMTPRGSYRSGLESHLDETRDHGARVDARLEELGQGSNPLMAVVGLAEAVLGQALAIGKAPFDLVRGSGGEEKVLKNAKDACATETLEIATYTAIERLARSVGDEETARLAASIRADEERMLQLVLREIPKLTEAVVGAGVEDESTYDVTTTGAADTVREAGETTKAAARKTTAATKAKARRARKVRGVEQAEGQIKGAVASDEQADLRASAAAGDGAAAFTLWERLRDTDFDAAEVWLRKAEESGDVRAAFQLGMLLWERRDVDAAEGMLRRANADPQGAHALGLLLWRERGNPDAAVEWLDRAALTDDPAAERDLGIVLRERGDLHGAHHWLSRAAERDSQARRVLTELG